MLKSINKCYPRTHLIIWMRHAARLPPPPLFVALSLFAVACMLTSTANLWYCHGSCSVWRSNQNRSGRATFPERFWKVNRHTLLRLNWKNEPTTPSPKKTRFSPLRFFGSATFPERPWKVDQQTLLRLNWKSEPTTPSPKRHVFPQFVFSGALLFQNVLGRWTNKRY